MYYYILKRFGPLGENFLNIRHRSFISFKYNYIINGSRISNENYIFNINYSKSLFSRSFIRHAIRRYSTAEFMNNLILRCVKRCRNVDLSTILLISRHLHLNNEQTSKNDYAGTDEFHNVIVEQYVQHLAEPSCAVSHT